jgi:trehalose 6-phosphate phosphatase
MRVQPGTPVRETVSPIRDAFLLDVDGTILDIAETPEEVIVPESLKSTLARLQEKTGGAVALVSGRRIADLDALFAPVELATIGCHGAEWRTLPGGEIALRASPLSARVSAVLRAAVADMAGLRIEEKFYTLAFHYRQAPEFGPELAARLRRAAAPFSELQLLHGKMVIEVKSGRFDKGEAVEALMRLQPFAGRRPVFLGDDTTDEDAFAEVHAMDGLGISVGREMPDAELMLPAPEAARQWLASIADGPD